MRFLQFMDFELTHAMIYDAGGGPDAEDVTVFAIHDDGRVEIFPED